MQTLLMTLLAIAIGADARTVNEDRPDGTKVEAGQSPIDVGFGSPHFADFDGDGVKDLLVGHDDGRLRIYKNIGRNDQPNFQDFTYFQAGGELGTVPAG